jgi:hypothetical protein
VIAPWTIRNAIVMHRLIPVSDETGITLIGTYNPVSAADPSLPYAWRFYLPVRHPDRLTEPQLSDRLDSRVLAFIGGHPLAPLAAAYRNTLRLLELAGSVTWRRSAGTIDLPLATARIGVIGFWILCVTALAGALTPAVRAAPRWLWAMPLLLALSVVLVNAETPRFREPIDPFLILPAACGLVALAGARRRRLGGAPVGGVRRAPVTRRGGQLVEVRERLA